ncbi:MULTISPECIES: N-formylglutamate amidohydrolase [unclassified Iodidimonas]|jgi:N-formylglutamate amidohydrolase|uniref:N-formylglutamate amidohydrolase n=1 Tax=unclassified Iodidimonas TaxID=2626145 RepID=UPI0024826686|nr:MULTISPECIES: N-formylglutamate amidohydrolase [unclassified Iodidimonas]
MTSEPSGLYPAPYRLVRPAFKAGPFLCASPHSGRYYPDDFKRASRLDELLLRRSEDFHVDELFQLAPDFGAPLLMAHYPRAYVDLNRAENELDPLLIRDPLPQSSAMISERVAAGLGTLARVVAIGMPIYHEPLSLAEAKARIARIHTPYHQALDALLSAAHKHHGWSVLLDCHSMPSKPLRAGESDQHGFDADIVLGDCHGASCDPRLINRAEDILHDLGYRVARNDPYAGGYCTQHHGRPDEGRHALQIEINRGLYMDEIRLLKKPAFEAVAADMGRLLKGLFSLDLGHADADLSESEPPRHLAAE